MKIGFVLDDTLDSTDGVQQYVLNIGAQLKKNGHQVHYLVGHTKRTDIPNVHSLSKNLKVTFNKNRMSMPLPTVKRRLRRLLKTLQFDVLHVQMPYSPFLGGRLILLANKMNVPVIGTFHILPASGLERSGLRLLGTLQRRTISMLSKVVAVSGPAKTCAQQVVGVKASVIPNPVDVKRYKPTHKTKRTNNNIVFLGRLVERKGCMQFLHALEWLNSRDLLPDDIQVTICGEGPLRQQLESYAELHHLSKKVSFAGKVTESEKVDYLQNATIAVFPSVGGESFGIVLIEAMAAGVPTIIAGDNPGYRFVMDNKQQQIVDPNNAEAFAAMLLHFLQNPKERERSLKWQQKRVTEFALPKVTSTLEKIYKEAIANSSKD